MIVGQVCLKEISQNQYLGTRSVLSQGALRKLSKNTLQDTLGPDQHLGDPKGVQACREALLNRIPAAVRSTGIIHLEPGTRHSARSGAHSSCAGVAGRNSNGPRTKTNKSTAARRH
jgi:hypothetical protein